MANVEQPRVNINADTRVGRHHNQLGPRRDCSRSSAIPIDIWEEIFVRCLPSEDPNHTACAAPLLLCQVCRAWRQLAISSPNLWSSMRVVVSLGEPRPHTALIAQWLERSGSLPLALSLYQTNEAEGNCIATGDVLEIFKQYIHRWQDIRLDLASPRCHNQLGPYKRKAPLLEKFHMRSQRLDEIPEQDLLGMFEEVPQLSMLSVSSIAALDYGADTNLTIPWNQLTHVSIDFDMSIGKVFLLLRKCHNLQKCNFGVKFEPDSLSPGMVIQTNLQSLQLMIGPQDLSIFFQNMTFPALTDIAIHGKGGPAELQAWPQEKFNTFLGRSEARLFSLGLHNTCIRSTHFIDLLQSPSMQALVELIIDDNADWTSPSCLSFSTMDMLTFNKHKPQGFLPALQCLKIRGLGCLWSVDSKTLADMAESRWRQYEGSAVVRLRSLHVQLSFLLSSADYNRLKQLQKEGLDLEINTSLY